MKFLKGAVLPAVIAWVTALLLLLLTSAMLLKSDDPEGAVRTVPTIISLLSAVLAGILSAKMTSDPGLEQPFFAGLMLSALHLLCSLFAGGGEKGAIFSIAMLIGQIALCFLVGLLLIKGQGTNARKMKKHAKKRYEHQKRHHYKG